MCVCVYACVCVRICVHVCTLLADAIQAHMWCCPGSHERSWEDSTEASTRACVQTQLQCSSSIDGAASNLQLQPRHSSGGACCASHKPQVVLRVTGVGKPRDMSCAVHNCGTSKQLAAVGISKPRALLHTWE